ncbi:MAG: JAB domain-containing protein [Sphingobium sp.]
MISSAALTVILLDDSWRPIGLLSDNPDWRTMVSRSMALQCRWLAIEQHRPDALPALPASSDIALSRTLARRLRAMEIGLVDHIIHTSAGQFSFRAAGLL